MSIDIGIESELAELSASFEHAHPRDVVAWAWNRFGDGLVFTASFEDPVLLHVVSDAAPATEVVLLDTQYLFAETHWYAQRLTRQLGLNLLTLRPDPSVVPDDRWQTDTEGCCQVRKVEPLNRALAGRTAWITGVRRADGPTRANAPIVSWDPARQLVKINPLATYTDDDMALYVQLH